MQQLFCCSGIHPLIRYRILSIKLAGQKLQNEVLHFRLKLEKTISQTKYFPRAMSTWFEFPISMINGLDLPKQSTSFVNSPVDE